MPFQSEKQRRFLWAEHPDIAKRWAHEYPNQRKLPMYAHDNKADGNRSEADSKPAHKEAALSVLNQAVLANNSHAVLQLMRAGIMKYASIAKKSDSIIEYLDVPHSEKPVAAGDEHVKPKQEQAKTHSENGTSAEPITDLPKLFSQKEKGQETAQKLAELLQKHAVVLAPKHRPGTPANAGLDTAKLQRKINESKHQQAMQQIFGGNPLPLAEQAKQPQQPKPAQPPKPAKPANVTSNNLAGNPIGTQGPLNSRNGVPTAQQNVTGNQAFGSANSVPGITQYGIT